MTTRVIIARHGQSNYNVQKRIQGRSDESVLTAKGQQDAQILGETLKDYPLTAIYCSPLQRAMGTAEIISNSREHPLRVQPLEMLKEIDLPLWENMVKDDVKEKFPEVYRLWKNQPQELKMTRSGGEEFSPVLSLYTQAQNFWQSYLPQHEGETILIVAHNGINRCLIMSAVSMNPEYYHSLQQSNCCINILNFTGGWTDPVQLESLNQTAHLGIPIPPVRSHPNPLRLLLVRHGETDWNRAGRFQGTRDIPLNQKGREQAELAAIFLRDVHLDFAITSPMLRPKETAEIIIAHHPHISLETRADLVEISHGLWEGKLESEIEAEFPGLLEQWQQTPATVQMPEGENLDQVWKRAIACWQEIVETFSTESQTGIVVAHDAINKVIICALLGLNPANFWNIKQGNGAVTVIDYPQGANGKPVLQALNITTHLGSGILDRTAAGAL
ncbi:histidine phosphatase family protein [Gloeocapsa sp. PCC 73106]|uniref:histidine phosphatase family protein n=1 Tax=Gloeocapsa sp. PCC 73106 TaxID=102232 RepID=UPI0002ACE31E|nr:histidine phosphatase family protein [Gloeocapsa sp. PCC 73106]ELR98389.1 fructose-2,6-bisphosphatase [Gloeocapsa sp. PCC 73106]